MVASLLSQSEVDYIKGGCLEDCRVDGRSCREFRHHSVVVSSTPTSSDAPLLIRSNGSSRILLDGTHVLCSVKADIVRPSEIWPDCGAVELSVEYHPHASGSSSSGSATTRNRSRNDEDVLQQLLEDLFLPHLVDPTSLCLARGELAWRLSIDLLVLACGGGASAAGPGALLDACGIAIDAALHNTWLPAVTVVPKEEEEANNNPASNLGLGVGGGRRDASNDTRTAELVVEGDMAKARRVFDLTADGGGTKTSGQQQRSSVHLVTITILKCYATSPSAGEPPTARYVCLLDATCDEVACSHCQIHVAVRTSSAPSSKKRASVCSLQTSGGGSVHLAQISEASRLAIAAAEDRQRHVEVTDLSSLAGAASASSRREGRWGQPIGETTMLLQELFALQ